MRAPNALALASVMIAAALAGCTADENPAGPVTDELGRVLDELGRPLITPDWHELALAAEEGHDHKDPKHHEGRTTPNFEVLGYDPLITDWHGATSGDYFCGDVVEREGRALSVVHSFGSDVAFVLADVTDPTKPKKLGEMVMENTQVYDVALTPDLRHVLVASSPLDSGPDMESPVPLPRAPPLPSVPILTWRNACGEETVLDGPEAGLPYASGLVLVNIENPLNPYVADFLSIPPRGVHSIRATDVDGETILLATVPQSPPFSPVQRGEVNYRASLYMFLGIDDSPQGGKLVPLSTYQYDGLGPTGGSGGPHDGTIQPHHPVTGETLAYLAYGNNGFVIINIDDPAEPQFVGYWADWEKVGPAADNGHYMHEALPIDVLWEGKHYTFIGEECVARTADTPSCLLYALDTTDPANPQFVGAWTLPVDVQWDGGLHFSLHYIALSGRTLFAAAYHGGIWAIDVSTEKAIRDMPSIGVFLPVNVSPKSLESPPRSILTAYAFGTYVLDGRPTIMDLEVLSDGTLVVWDGQSGIYGVTFDATYPAPAPAPWPLGYNADIARVVEPGEG